VFAGSIELDWDDQTSNESPKYKVSARSDRSQNWSVVGVTDESRVTIPLTQGGAERWFEFRVVVLGADGSSLASTELRVEVLGIRISTTTSSTTTTSSVTVATRRDRMCTEAANGLPQLCTPSLMDLYGGYTTFVYVKYRDQTLLADRFALSHFNLYCNGSDRPYVITPSNEQGVTTYRLDVPASAISWCEMTAVAVDGQETGRSSRANIYPSNRG
jgi:hypothetical protein